MTAEKINEIITPEELLKHWQGHRNLTRRVIEAFPEKELFTHRIGGMRSFADMLMELLGIAGPGIMEIVNGVPTQLNEHFEHGNQKSAILAKWDETTEVLDAYMPQIGRDRYHDKIKAFGQYEGTVLSTILYYIDNEIHHRAQGYVYLRSLGVEPPAFWDRP
ncbi:MAG: damage-inducible protein DinB [Ferruginibacter sp.]|nr:damage-inducible protein DinB [Ferruginibacter sp.]MCC7380102.1 damage-inducible protein DinB [Chitinophagaceae bacterium]